MGKKGARTIPFGAAHTYMAYIRKYPPGHVEQAVFSCNFQVSKDKCEAGIEIQKCHVWLTLAFAYLKKGRKVAAV